jgi:antibiotic biosynthesis monooxygenase (ABM) superfamily enzyme
MSKFKDNIKIFVGGITAPLKWQTWSIEFEFSNSGTIDHWIQSGDRNRPILGEAH